MPLVSLKEILDGANNGNRAVPAFDAVDHASAEAVVQAAEAKNMPVIVMLPEAAFPLVDVDAFMDYLVFLTKKSKVPVALHLDHGQTLEAVMKSIGHGFTSVMIDGSSLPLDQNIALAKKITELAHSAGVSVEAELGHVGGDEGGFDGHEGCEDLYTKTEEAKEFVDATNVDALAVAIGTVHGIYKGTPKLDLDRLRKIKATVGIPLVLHGGSGLTDDDFVGAIRAGINKVNLFTEISMSALARSVEYVKERGNKLHFAEMVLAGRRTVFESASRYLDLFALKNGTSGGNGF